MLKRLLGIKKIEESIEKAFSGIKNCWSWIEHLNEKNKVYEERIKKLEESNKKLAEAMLELFEKVESRVEKVELNIPELPERDVILLKIMHQYAAFDESRAISTNEIFQNLTFEITERGLRKKLEQMQREGLLGSVKRGTVRFWYIQPGKIAKVKRAIKVPEQ